MEKKEKFSFLELEIKSQVPGGFCYGDLFICSSIVTRARSWPRGFETVPEIPAEATDFRLGVVFRLLLSQYLKLRVLLSGICVNKKCPHVPVSNFHVTPSYCSTSMLYKLIIALTFLAYPFPVCSSKTFNAGRPMHRFSIEAVPCTSVQDAGIV